MGTLADTAATRLAWIKKRGELPDWWPLLQAAVGILLFLGVGIALIRASDTPDTPEPAPAPVEQPTAPDVGPSPEPAPADPAPADNPEAGTVPLEARQLAARAATALFTGDFSDVPVRDGTTTPTVTTPHPNPQVEEPEVDAVGDNWVRFRVVIDPTPEDPTPRPVFVTLTETAGTWTYEGV